MNGSYRAPAQVDRPQLHTPAVGSAPGITRITTDHTTGMQNKIDASGPLEAQAGTRDSPVDRRIYLEATENNPSGVQLPASVPCFTVRDKELMLVEGDLISDFYQKQPDKLNSMWGTWAVSFSQHSAKEWRNYWETTLKPYHSDLRNIMKDFSDEFDRLHPPLDSQGPATVGENPITEVVEPTTARMISPPRSRHSFRKSPVVGRPSPTHSNTSVPKTRSDSHQLETSRLVRDADPSMRQHNPEDMRIDSPSLPTRDLNGESPQKRRKTTAHPEPGLSSNPAKSFRGLNDRAERGYQDQNLQHAIASDRRSSRHSSTFSRTDRVGLEPVLHGQQKTGNALDGVYSSESPSQSSQDLPIIEGGDRGDLPETVDELELQEMEDDDKENKNLDAYDSSSGGALYTSVKPERGLQAFTDPPADFDIVPAGSDWHDISDTESEILSEHPAASSPVPTMSMPRERDPQRDVSQEQLPNNSPGVSPRVHPMPDLEDEDSLRDDEKPFPDDESAARSSTGDHHLQIMAPESSSGARDRYQHRRVGQNEVSQAFVSDDHYSDARQQQSSLVASSPQSSPHTTPVRNLDHESGNLTMQTHLHQHPAIRSRYKDTQALLDEETQTPDFELPLPEDSGSEHVSDEEAASNKSGDESVDDEFDAARSAPPGFLKPRIQGPKYSTPTSAQPLHESSNGSMVTAPLSATAPPATYAVAVASQPGTNGAVKPLRPLSTPQEPVPLSSPRFPSSTAPCLTDASETDVLTYIAAQVRRGFREEDVYQALHWTSINASLTERVLVSLKAGKGFPRNVPGIWSEDDDAVLMGGDNVKRKRLEKWHGPEFYQRRLQHLKDE
ncbi:MAG: hypothetical protein M1828_007453 [Chrysothrix sp. TS-e1954]|nr:MAG: hypothetical protein M1828_007453 [Chrysothrix sp. TS-e1954]